MSTTAPVDAAGLVAASGLPPHEAERLLVTATGSSRADLATSAAVDGGAAARFETLVSRRCAGEPLQYLEGTTDFGPITLAVDPRALIPRPETEAMWDDAVRSLGLAGPGTVVVDLGTGSGALSLALKHAFPEAQVHATDMDPEALTLAAENADRLGLGVTFHEGDLFEALPRKLMGRIDLLVANPPYVTEQEFSGLPIDVRDHEPRQALVAGPSGLEVIERIGAEAYWWLGVHGWAFCEIGETQGEEAADLFTGLDREVRQDLAGRDRYVAARRGASCCV